MAAKTGAGWKVVDLPPGVTDYLPDAFSAALARAGAQVLRGAERLSGYVYRHALASDMKADGATREQIAMALGHAVTKTQDTYGRAVGGGAGKRIFSVTAARGESYARPSVHEHAEYSCPEHSDMGHSRLQCAVEYGGAGHSKKSTAGAGL